MRLSLLILGLTLLLDQSALAHDIPNARVDRSIQATLEPGLLKVDYEVGLSELTLIQDLRQFVSELPGADRRAWFEEYGKVTGPLNAKGLLLTVNGEDVELRSIGFVLSIESHPLFTFHFQAKVPPQGRLTLNDTNYIASEGTSRLALRPGKGIRVEGDDLSTDVTQIPIRPVWQLDKNEERRTRRVTVDYALASQVESSPKASTVTTQAPASKPDDSLSRLLDRESKHAGPMLWLFAFVLGAAHAIQPGHGKSLVLASSLGPGSNVGRGALLGLTTAIVHMASVALIAGLLWATRAIRPEQVHLTLAHAAGFVIASIGCWKLGRHLAGYGEHDRESEEIANGTRRLIPLALAGGAVPCWDAVALVLVAEAIGRLQLGLTLLVAFSLGMATILVGLGVVSSRFRALFDRFESRGSWERCLGIFGGLILIGIGLMLLNG